MAIERRNYGSGHTYTVDGVKFDGVTTLIGDGLNKPALLRWASRSAAEYAVDHWDELSTKPVTVRLDEIKGAPWADRDAAARRGTEVHRLASELVRGVEVDVPDELAGHVESYVRFLDSWHPVPVLVETWVCNRKVRYAGTLDLVCDLRLGGKVERWLLDIKTARSGVFGEVALQLAAYANADTYQDADGEHPMMPVDAVGVVHVRSDGYDVYRLPHDPAIFGVFRHVAFVARQMPLMRDWVSPALTVPTR